MYIPYCREDRMGYFFEKSKKSHFICDFTRKMSIFADAMLIRYETGR